jgi:hypothetical protein
MLAGSGVETVPEHLSQLMQSCLIELMVGPQIAGFHGAPPLRRRWS